MSFTSTFEDQTVDPVSKAPIVIPVGAVDSTHTSLTLTGKGAANFGAIQQTNLLHILENFASATQPANPTIGQIWYDSGSSTVKVLTSVSPLLWVPIGSIQITGPSAPPPAVTGLGSLWFQSTGTGSGILYVYTGFGRYPDNGVVIGGWDQVWPAPIVIAGREEYDVTRELIDRLIAWSGVSTFSSGAIGRVITNLTDFSKLDLSMRQNFEALVSPDPNILISQSTDLGISRQAPSDNTLFYFNDSNNPSDGIIGGLNISGVPDPTVNGTIMINGVVTTVPAGYFYHFEQVEDAYIVWDQTNTLIARDGSTGTPLAAGTYGPYFVCQQLYNGTWQYDNNYGGTGANSGWTTFTPLAGMYVIGTISTYMADTLAANNLVYPIDKFAQMWAHAVPLVGTKYEHLKVEPNSNDWDTLLAAAKYAINRLEVPPQYVTSISDLPFVYDGHQVPLSLQSFANTDPRYPSPARRSNRKAGIATLVQNYSETLNTLNTAIANKFSIRGIDGAAGTNPTFGPNTAVQVIAPNTTPGLSAVLNTGIGTVRVSFKFNSMDELTRYLGSASAIEFDITQTAPSPTPADTNFIAMLAQVGVVRISADRIRFYGQSLPLTITQPIVNMGIWNANVPGKILASVTVSGVTMDIVGYRVSNTQFDLSLVFNAGGVLAGTTAIAINQVVDTETY